MRLPIFLLLLLVAMMLAAEPGTATAQPAGSYPWCFRDNRSGASLSCYFTTREQCMATLLGLGGICVQNPYRPPAAVRPEGRR